MSDGRLNLTYYATAELMPTDQIPDAIINGMVEWYHSYGPYFSGKIGTLCDMEGGCTNKLSLEGQWNVWNAGAGDILRRAYAEQNLHYITFLGLHPIGGDNVYSREELDSVEDLRGLKFRSIGISAEIMTNLGASCTYFPWEELYLALQTGTVDAAEMATPSEMFDLGLAEVAKHWYYPAFISSGWCNYVANMDAYDSLPLDLRAIVDQAGMAVNVRHGAEPWVMDYERIPEFIEAGVVIHQWTEEDMDKFVAAWIKAFNEMGESGDPYCKEFYDVVKQTRTKLDEWPEQ
jgi:TRAP-type mannitol/chloroaromatic compound transport system substrate-binding protein